MEEKLGAEIFDVDHTITKNITSLSYLLLLIKRKVFSITILRHIPYICMNYKYGHMDDKHFDRHFDELVGVEKTFMDDLAVENFNNMTISRQWSRPSATLSNLRWSRIFLST